MAFLGMFYFLSYRPEAILEFRVSPSLCCGQDTGSHLLSCTDPRPFEGRHVTIFKQSYCLSFDECQLMRMPLFQIVVDVFKKIGDSNWASVIIAAVCILVLAINDEVLKVSLQVESCI